MANRIKTHVVPAGVYHELSKYPYRESNPGHQGENLAYYRYTIGTPTRFNRLNV